MMAERPEVRVAVTGMGVLASTGVGVENFWESLVSGKSGIGPVTHFDAEAYTSQVASEVKDFDPSDYMDPKEARRNDRYTQFAVGAAKLAVEDASIDLDSCDKSRLGVLVGSGIGGLGTIERQVGTLLERGPRKVSPFMIPSLIANIAGGVIAIELGARGPNFGIVSACATGTHAIGESLRKMKNGEVDVMIAGGSEAAITRIGFAGFCSMKAMSTSFNDEPSRASRPFDKNRDGFVMGEGAGVLVLERMDQAQARGARIYAELIGYWSTCDAYHITAPDLEALALTECMNGALADAGLKTTEVDYLNAHGTSTQYNDRSETQAIKNVFGDHARDSLLVSSTKSMTGHLLGAAGAIEAAACCKAIQTGLAPPTINYEEPDPDCDLDYVPNQARPHEIKVALSNNSGFGGHNASLIFRQP